MAGSAGAAILIVLDHHRVQYTWVSAASWSSRTTVSATCLGTAYVTANQVPEHHLRHRPGRRPGQRHDSGAGLAGGPPARRAPGAQASAGNQASAENQAGQIASAMLSWTVLCARPGERDLSPWRSTPLATSAARGRPPRCAHAAIVGVSSRMLVVFAPQVLLYGLAVVLYGILQAHLEVHRARSRARPVQRGGHLRLPLRSSRSARAIPRGAGRAAPGSAEAYGCPRRHPRLVDVALVLTPAGSGAAGCGCGSRPHAALPGRSRNRGSPPWPLPAAITLIASGRPRWSWSWCWPTARRVQGRTGPVQLRLADVLRCRTRCSWCPIAIDRVPGPGRRSTVPVFDKTAAASTRAIMLVSWLGAALAGRRCGARGSGCSRTTGEMPASWRTPSPRSRRG